MTMRLATIDLEGSEQVCIAVHEDSWAPLSFVEPALAGDLLALLTIGLSPDQLSALEQRAGRLHPNLLPSADSAIYRPPYRRARKIWGIGLNYAEHAKDLGEVPPSQPASFIKGDHTIIGPGDAIVIPPDIGRVTAEAELGLIIGWGRDRVSRCLDAVFGVCPILDQTAEDILAQNPRYLTRSKNYPTFLSFGPEVVSLDEFTAACRLSEIEVATCIGTRMIRSNIVGNMTHSPERILEFHSRMMPFYPGDIILTGTPGAAVLGDRMTARAQITGLRALTNPVRTGI